jgi:hypothetical protein
MFEKVLIYVSRKLKRSLYLGTNFIFKMIFIVKDRKYFLIIIGTASALVLPRRNHEYTLCDSEFLDGFD